MNVSEIEWKKGALYGVVTYVTAVLITGVVFYFERLGTTLEAVTTQGEGIALTIPMFYNSQFVGGREFSGETITTLSVMEARGFIISPLMYYAIPVATLVLISAVFVYTETDASDRLEAFLSGSSLVIGYLGMSLFVVLALRFAVDRDILLLPVGMAVLSGILYPVVVGGITGFVANEVKSYQKAKEEAVTA